MRSTAPTGTTTVYQEGIDIDQTRLNGVALASLTEGGISCSIDQMRLPSSFSGAVRSDYSRRHSGLGHGHCGPAHLLGIQLENFSHGN
jgi:hypothetical protein